MKSKQWLVDVHAFTNSPVFSCGGNPNDPYYAGYCDALDRVLEHLEHFPTVDAVEVKHGRWVHPKGYGILNGFLCSECNQEEASYHPIHPIHPLGNGSCKADEHGNFYYPPKINYCPNCGAKMDSED